MGRTWGKISSLPAKKTTKIRNRNRKRKRLIKSRRVALGEGKRRNEFAEWHEHGLRNDIIVRNLI